MSLLFPLSPVEEALTNLHSVQSFQQARPIEDPHIHAVFDYREPLIRDAIYTLKKRRSTIVANFFAQYIDQYVADLLNEYEGFIPHDTLCLIPIPVTKGRWRNRGFNQAELLAHAIDNVHPERYRVFTGVLVKKRDTGKQALIHDKNLRQKNMEETFAVYNEDLIKDKYVVVIDDVTTTGATFKEARKMLMQAGAREVICIAAAH